MPRTLTHKFSDLPLIVDGPFEDNGVEGEAVISYWPNGQWEVDDISITVSRRKNDEEMAATGLTNNRIYEQRVLDVTSPLYGILRDRLMTGKYKRMNIQDDVRDALAEDHADAPSIAADQRRDERMMERA